MTRQERREMTVLRFDPSDPLGTPFREAVAGVSARFIKQQTETLRDISYSLEPFCELTNAFTQSGKRIRPACAWWGYLSYDPKPRHPEAVLQAAASLDIEHVGILIHDDIFDDSMTRRGLQAAHLQLATQTPTADPARAKHFGKSAAVLLGTLIQTWSETMIRRCGMEPRRVLAALEVFDNLRTEVMAGQYLDLLVAESAGICDADTGVSLSELDQTTLINTYKTARYTVQRPLEFGARLAGAPLKLCRELFDFGLPVGRAFQLRDDLLGVFGSTTDTGKPVGDDLREGKQTLLIIEAMSAATRPQKQIIYDALYRNDEAANMAARQVIAETGAPDRVIAQIAADRETALQMLDQMEINPEARTALTAIATQITDVTGIQF
jgi:geranylgeranyl diphosphate synthase type I